MDQGLGNIFGSILGGGQVDYAQQTPQIDTTNTDADLAKLNGDPNAAQQQQAAGLMQQIAQGNGPSAAQALLNQQTATSMADTNALASSGSGQAGQGLARRQAMMQGASATQNLGGQAATARAQEQLGALGQFGAQTTAARGQDIQSALGAAGIHGQIASNQANLQEQTQEQQLEAQKANQQSGNDMFKQVMGGLAGAAMIASSPQSKKDAKSASSVSSPPAAKDLIASAASSGAAPAAASQPNTGEKVGAIFAGLSGGSKGAGDYAMAIRQKHSGLYKPESMSQFMQLSSPPEAKTDVKPASIPEGYDQPKATPQTQRPEVRMPHSEGYDRDNTGAYVESSPRGYAPPATVTQTPEMTVSADDAGDQKMFAVQGRYAMVPPTPTHEYPNPELPSVPVGYDYQAPAPRGYAAMKAELNRMQMGDEPEKHLPETVLPAKDAYTRTAPTSMHQHKAPTGVGKKEAAKVEKRIEQLSSPPAAKKDMQAETVDSALRNLHPYSYSYKDPGNEPIPNPTGKERFFGVMTTDLKKHPVTAAMVSGHGADEKIAVPAATSFTLASAAHLQQKYDELENRFSALEKMMSKGRR